MHIQVLLMIVDSNRWTWIKDGILCGRRKKTKVSETSRDFLQCISQEFYKSDNLNAMHATEIDCFPDEVTIRPGNHIGLFNVLCSFMWNKNSL